MIPIFVLKGSSPKIGDKHLEIYNTFLMFGCLSLNEDLKEVTPSQLVGWRGKCDCYQADSVRSSGDENQILQHDFVSHEAIGQPTSFIGGGYKYKKVNALSLSFYIRICTCQFPVRNAWPWGLYKWPNSSGLLGYIVPKHILYKCHSIKKHCIFSSPLVEVFFSDLQMYVVTRLLIVH